MHALALRSVNQQTKFKVPSFSDSKDVNGAPKFKKNGSRDSDHTRDHTNKGWFVILQLKRTTVNLATKFEKNLHPPIMKT